MDKNRLFLRSILITTLVLLIGVSGALAQSEETTVTFLHTEFEQARVDVIKNLVERFEEQNPGININQIPVRESDLRSKVASMQAADNLPDVIELDLSRANSYASEGLTAPEISTEIVNEMGTDNFAQGVLSMAQNPETGQYNTIPVDGWIDLIWYRKDLFEEHDLAPPNTWERLKKAAKELNNPPNMYGVVIGTHPEEVYTYQIYQHIALSNDARAFDAEGNINIDTPEQVESLQYYKDLIDYTPPGLLYWRQARQFYITGRVSMIFYSNYILSDLVGEGVTVENLPEKTAAVSSLKGPNGDATNGLQYSLTPMEGADKEAVKKWIKFVLKEGYSDWLSMSVGKTPLYKPGLDAYSQNETFDSFDPGLPETFVEGVDKVQRWGFPEGEVFPFIEDIHGDQIVRRGVTKVIDGRMSPEEAAEWMQERAEELR